MLDIITQTPNHHDADQLQVETIALLIVECVAVAMLECVHTNKIRVGTYSLGGKRAQSDIKVRK